MPWQRTWTQVLRSADGIWLSPDQPGTIHNSGQLILDVADLLILFFKMVLGSFLLV